jgi:hypothetical protein
MSDEPGAPEREGASEAALARRLLSLRQELDLLGREENRAQLRVLQLRSQVIKYEGYAQEARARNQEQLARYAHEQLAAVRSQLASAEAQQAELAAQRDDLTWQQQRLLEQLGVRRPEPKAGGSLGGDFAWTPAQAPRVIPLKRRRRRGGWVVGFSALALMLVVTLTLAGVIRLPFLHLLQQVGNALTQPSIDQPFFKASGAGPANQQCVTQFGQPCYSPQDIQQAFRLNPLYRQGYTGKGQTIVLLGVGNTTTLQDDARTFDQAWGLPAINLTILQPFGSPTPYSCADGVDDLAEENTLDVEWAHAIAPGAKIVLLIGSNDSHQSPQDNCFFVGIDDAISYAVDHQLGQVISMSYGSSELGLVTDTPDERAREQQAYGDDHALFHKAVGEGMTILAASGDAGVTNENDYTKSGSYWNKPNVSWPASDSDVLAVGGTRLNVDVNTSVYTSEVVWNDDLGVSGGGLSSVFTEPSYQKNLPNQNLLGGRRALPDVAFPADNMLTYESFSPGTFQNTPQWAHWEVIGGTSVSTPCWAALIAIADQMRGKPLGLVQPALYSLAGKDMHDILAGDNSYAQVQGYKAQKGFDLATGWGTPIANVFLPALVQAANKAGG